MVAPQSSLCTSESCTSAEPMCSQAIHLNMKTRGQHRNRAYALPSMHLGMKTQGLHIGQAYALLSHAPWQEDLRYAPRRSGVRNDLLLSRAPRHKDSRTTLQSSLCAPELCTLA
ncbi:hypothetical protein BHE74_00017770 [Ensete ventricosum]|nr:hypothetical protein BHE74_00017770 [Ensete ventricosum]